MRFGSVCNLTNPGVVRGLLCHRCNVLLGGWDDHAWLQSAIKYMKLADTLPFTKGDKA